MRWITYLVAGATLGCIAVPEDDLPAVDAGALTDAYQPLLRRVDADPEPEPEREPERDGPPDGEPPPSCPHRVADLREISAQVGDVLRLSPAPEQRVPGAEYYWFVVDQPSEGRAWLVESFFNRREAAAGGSADDPSTPVVHFYADAGGQYRLQLTVERDGCVWFAAETVILLSDTGR
jgi:hypothetical protein